MTTLTAQQFYDLLEAHGLEACRCSGRHLRGAEHPGFITDNPMGDTPLFIRHWQFTDERVKTAVVLLFHTARTYRIGHSNLGGYRTVVYFPTLRFPKE